MTSIPEVEDTTINPKFHQTLNPETRNPKPETQNPKPETQNPKPETPHGEAPAKGGCGHSPRRGSRAQGLSAKGRGEGVWGLGLRV